MRVKNLASHVLAQLVRRVAEDWEYLGMTTGDGLVRPGKSYSTTPKKLFVKPLSE